MFRAALRSLLGVHTTTANTAFSAPRDFDRYLDAEEFKYVLWLYEVFRKISTVPGHIVEVGVARGRNAVIFGHLIKMTGEESIRRYFGFDTFAGYTDDDLRCSPHLSASEWRATTKAFVEDRLRAVGLDRVCRLIEGDVKQTAPQFIVSGSDKFVGGKLRVALLYIDCNAYAAAKASMDIFRPHMTPGGIICIDEKLQGGETEALAEFCREQGTALVKDPGPFGLPAYTRIERP